MANKSNGSSHLSLSSSGHETNTRNRSMSEDNLDADTEESSSESEDAASKGQLDKDPDENSSEKPSMSNTRRLCLVASLLLCVFTVFAFAFILPCHHKTCLKETKCKEPKNWSKNFTGVAPLVLRELSGNDSSRHILVGFSHNGRGFHMLNHTCPACHGGVVTVDGRNGHQLWTSGILGKLGNVLCDLSVKNLKQPSCIALENQNKMLRIDSHSGYQKWTIEKPGTITAFRTIRDIDEDGIGEVVLLYSPRYEGGAKRGVILSELCVLSGRTGKVIGVSLPVLQQQSTTTNLHHDGFLLVHKISASAQVLLVGIKLKSQATGTLLAIKIEELATRVRNRTVEKNMGWGQHTLNRYGFIELFKDSLVLTKPMFADLNNDGVEDIVLCTLDRGLTVKALNGNDTRQMWSRALTSRDIHRALPTIVSFGDKVTDIAIMIQLNNRSTRIVVLNGRNGLALWMFSLNKTLTVPPVGVPQSKHTPRGLLLWLPKYQVNKYVSKRNAKPLQNQNIGGEFERRDGPRKRRKARSMEESEDEGSFDDFLEGFLNKHTEKSGDKDLGSVEKRNEGDDEGRNNDDDDGDDDDDASLQAKLESIEERSARGGAGTDDRDVYNALSLSFPQPMDQTTHPDKDSGRSSKDIRPSGEESDVRVVGKNNAAVSQWKTTGGDIDDDDNGGDDDDNGGDDDDDGGDDDGGDGGDDDGDDNNGGDNGGDDDDGDNDGDDDGGITIKNLPTPQDLSKYLNSGQQSRTPQHVMNSYSQSEGIKVDRHYIALRNFLKNLENRLRRETSKKTKPSPLRTPTPGVHTESPTMQSEGNIAKAKNTSAEGSRSNETDISGSQNDKALTCNKPLDKLNKDVSAVLVYRDSKHQLQLIEIVEERVINIAPEEYLNKFGEQPLSPYSCIEFVPYIRTRPLVTDVDGDGRLDLMYAVDYITLSPEDRTTHLMKLRKVDLLEIIANGHKVATHLYSSSRKDYKRNEYM